jgi:hypothetical protein
MTSFFKPMTLKNYQKWIGAFGWSIQKAGTDYDLLDENENYVCTVNVLHSKKELAPFYVKKTADKLAERGLI